MTDKSRCSFDPVTLLGMPIGMLHCPECGEMVLAGVPHPPPMDEIDWSGVVGPGELTEDSSDHPNSSDEE